MKKIVESIFIIVILTIATIAGAESEQQDSLPTLDLSELDRQLNNPLANIWSLTFQNNTAVKTGDAVDGSEYSNVLFFQPFMPFEIGSSKKTMLTLRPVFPLVTQPVFKVPDLRNSSGHKTGLGDIQLLTLAGPNRGKGLIWGSGTPISRDCAAVSSQSKNFLSRRVLSLSSRRLRKSVTRAEYKKISGGERDCSLGFHASTF